METLYKEKVGKESNRLENLYKEEVRKESNRLNAQHWKDVEQRVAVELGNKLNERRPRPTQTGPVPLPKYDSSESLSYSEPESSASEVKIEGSNEGRRPILKPRRRLPARSNHS